MVYKQAALRRCHGLHLGADFSTELQAWNVNFRLEFCQKKHGGYAEVINVDQLVFGCLAAISPLLTRVQWRISAMWGCFKWVLNVHNYLELPQILCFCFLMKKIDMCQCFWDRHFFGWFHPPYKGKWSRCCLLKNRPSGEPEDAGTIIDESIPKATEWTYGEQHSCIFLFNLLIWLGDIESLWRIPQNHLGLIKGPDIDKVQGKWTLNLQTYRWRTRMSAVWWCPGFTSQPYDSPSVGSDGLEGNSRNRIRKVMIRREDIRWSCRQLLWVPVFSTKHYTG